MKRIATNEEIDQYWTQKLIKLIRYTKLMLSVTKTAKDRNWKQNKTGFSLKPNTNLDIIKAFQKFKREDTKILAAVEK